MLYLWSGPPESNCWFSFAPAFQLFRAVESMSLLHLCNLIVLGFNDTSTLVGNFVSSPRDREKRDSRDSRRDEREDREERGTGVKVKKQKK